MMGKRNRSFVRLAAASMLAGTMLCASAFAQDSAGGAAGGMGGDKSGAPSTAASPATQPAHAVIPVDSTTPRGALKSLLTAMQSGDAALIRELMASGTPTEKKMVDSMANRAQAESQFRKAVIGAFGADKAKTLTGDTESASQTGLAQIDGSDEKIDGEKATVMSSGQPPLVLKHVDGKWKIPASEFAKDANPKEIDQRLDDMEFATKLIGGYAADVTAGKYKTVEDARDAIQSQMMVEMMKRQNANAPTTAPSAPTDPTAPATQPEK